MARHRTGHLLKRGENFYVRWTLNGKVFSKSLRDGDGNPITTRRQAEEAQAKFMAAFVVADEAAALESIAAKLQGRHAELVRLQDEENPPLLIADAWGEYLAAPNRPDSGESTLRQYGFQFSAFVSWMTRNHAEVAALRQVTKSIVEEYAQHLNQGRLSASTYNKHLALLTLVFRVLKHKARLTANPWEGIQRKRVASQSRRELTLDELKQVCQSATGELRDLLALGLYSGLRLGDCATLRWSEVDLSRRLIRRIPNKTARRNPLPVIIPIHQVLFDILSTVPPKKRGDFVLPKTAALYQKRTDLITDMVQNHFIGCGIRPHKAGTGKDGKRAVVDVGFHSLRHSFVSLCRESNAPLSVVQSIVGHSNPAMTRHYTHVGDLAASRAVAALPSVIDSDDTPPLNSERSPSAITDEIRQAANQMTPDNWRVQRDKILALVPRKPKESDNGGKTE